MEVQALGISRFAFGSPGTKWHLGAGHVARHKVCYKREGGGFPKSRLWWVLWVCVYPWFFHALCSNYALTNLLFSLWKSMWVIDLLVNLFSPHPGALTCPSIHKMLWAKERTPTPSPFIVFSFGLVVESIKEFRGASHVDPKSNQTSCYITWSTISKMGIGFYLRF